HGRLEPWRFILYRGDARVEIGSQLAALAEQREGPLSEGRRNQELARFSRAPLVIGVVSIPRDNPKIPQWEMFLSGGMAAMNLMIAANALGYGTNMISNWYSDVPEGRALLGLAPQERVIGFIHIGSYAGPAPERPRPDPAKLYSDYSGPWAG
ncbi:nitroreductase, partial [Mesorhizobium sp. M7A.F.Ca.CA.004.11.2.1]